MLVVSFLEEISRTVMHSLHRPSGKITMPVVNMAWFVAVVSLLHDGGFW